MKTNDISIFDERCFGGEDRPDDYRKPVDRDMGRIIHGSAFRRLQGKTQVMGVGEGDFHRTRLTHSIEAGQIGMGLVRLLRTKYDGDNKLSPWIPDTSLIIAACFAHDLGHPPYGHAGERALQQKMVDHGGFEGNAQTIRILTKLEKYQRLQGINPTRRTVLSVLKYPACYADYDKSNYQKKPPKCFYETEQKVVNWALEPFSEGDQTRFRERGVDDRPQHMSLDASIMECADDIAYGVHDLEDIIARDLVRKAEILDAVKAFFDGLGDSHVGTGGEQVDLDTFKLLFEDSYTRKRTIGRLVNLFVSNVSIGEIDGFEHALMRYRLQLPDDLSEFQSFLKHELTYKLVVERAEIQMLERKGQRFVRALFDELSNEPANVIPRHAWEDLDPGDTDERRVCDYIAGMTDSFAERIYQRLFTPGYGSSRDEL